MAKTSFDCRQTRRSIGLILLLCTFGSGCTLSSSLVFDNSLDEPDLTYYDLIILTKEERRADQLIVKEINLYVKEQYSKNNLKIYSHNGIVLLLGTMSDALAVLELTEQVSAIPKVKQVHNFIHPPSPAYKSQSMADVWVGVQFKLALSHLPNNLQARTKIIARNGTIYVLGIIREWEKADLVQVVQQVGQAHKLILLTEILD